MVIDVFMILARFYMQEVENKKPFSHQNLYRAYKVYLHFDCWIFLNSHDKQNVAFLTKIFIMKIYSW